MIREEWRKIDCKIYSGAPTVSQTTGQTKMKVKIGQLLDRSVVG